MNDRKICFIFCTNNELYEKECISYIHKLNVPEGYEIEIVPVKGASSMTAGYNQAMRETNARYKVYLHQDVFIIYPDFIEEIVRLFQEKEIGMIGMVGSLEAEKTGVMWSGKRVGMVYANNVYFANSPLFGRVDGTYQEVSAVDGLLIATQYDLNWREDLFKGWDFYDMSQSMEFRKQGYKVVVPAMEKPWCIHDDGILNLSEYYQEREIFLREYNSCGKGETYLWLHDGIEQPLTREAVERLGLSKKGGAVCIPADDMDMRNTDSLTEEELLLDERYTENGLLVERKLLVAVGGRNRYLPAKWEYELALRIVQEAPVYIMNKEQMEAAGIVTDAGDAGIATDAGDAGFVTDAYVLGRYAGFLKKYGLLDTVLEALLAEVGSCSQPQEAQRFLEEMLSHAERYDKLYEGTQPILIYLGPTYCYNILNVFARELGSALERQGERVEYYDTSKEDVNGLAKLAGKQYKASIGFQTWLMSVERADGKGNLQDFIGGPKYNFIVDHPIWLDEQLSKTPRRFYALTHDRNYQTFIERYYFGVSGTYLLPPGGQGGVTPYGEEERVYDITFLGTYGDYRNKLQVIAACVPSVRFLAARFLRNMVKHPELTAEAAFGEAAGHYGIALDDTEFRKLFFEMKAVIQAAMYYYREKVIGTLLDAGITLHVYGESWEESPFAENPCLVKHSAVPAEKSGEVLGRTKISLNVMAWHKDGFTERIADSMLAGAVVVSDRSTQLEEEYADELVLYELDKLQELPGKVKKLLEEPEHRKKLAKKAREKALSRASWDKRAEQLLNIIEKEMAIHGR